MLNELSDLSASLAEAGVSIPSWHKHFKPNPKKTTYYVLIDGTGKVSDILPLKDIDRITSTRKWEVANGVSFPSFNVLPLYKIRSNESDEKEAKAFKKSLSDTKAIKADTSKGIAKLKNQGTKLWKATEEKRVAECLQTLSKKLNDLLGKPSEDHLSISVLIERVQNLGVMDLFSQLDALLERKITESPQGVEDFFDFLFFYAGKTPKNVSVILELADQSSFEYPANHPKVQEWINERLLLLEDAGTKQISLTDAFGKSRSGWEETFPQVRLSVLGNVVLRAMSHESACQARYGSIDANSFPVGIETRSAMKKALEWLSNPDLRGKTWRDISDVSGTRCVLFAYPSTLPKEIPELASFFGGADEAVDADGALFSAYAKRVADALKGLVASKTEAEIRVFVLGKPDGFRTKVFCNRQYNAKRVLEAAQEWQVGCRNIPAVRIRRFDQSKKGTSIWQAPQIPFPSEVQWCLNTVWQRQGTHPERVRGLSIEDSLSLLLDTGPHSHVVVSSALAALLKNSTLLLLALGQAHNRGLVHLLPQKYNKQPLLFPTILGLLLHKLDRMKGEYMDSPPYLIGRLLSFCDQLHERYCQKVREGSIPPQLVGNALMPTALETPQKALAILSNRILPYQAWAKTVRGEDAGLPRYFLAEIGKLSASLSSQPLPGRCDDGDKAEMLLGYLAFSGKTGDGTGANTDHDRGGEIQ
jgi:hypothetical protein